MRSVESTSTVVKSCMLQLLSIACLSSYNESAENVEGIDDLPALGKLISIGDTGQI